MTKKTVTIIFVALALAGCRDDGDSIEKKVEVAQTPVARKTETPKTLEVNSEKSVNSIDDFIYSEVFPDYRGEGYITYFDLSEEDCKSGQHKFVTLYVDGSVHHDKVISKKISPYYEYKNEEADIDVVESACQVQLSKASGAISQPLVVFMDVESVDNGNVANWKEIPLGEIDKSILLTKKYLKNITDGRSCAPYFSEYEGRIVGHLRGEVYQTDLAEDCKVYSFEKVISVVCFGLDFARVYQGDRQVVCSDLIPDITSALEYTAWGSIFVNGIRYYMYYYYFYGHPKKAGYRFVPADEPTGYAGKRALGQYYIIRVPSWNVEKISR